jgi:hypothetical protein
MDYGYDLHMERFFHCFKRECLDRERFPMRTQAKLIVFESIVCFYNRTRKHSTLNSMSPVAYEQFMREISTSESPQKWVKIVFAIVFLLGTWQLFGQPLWHRET